MSIFKNQNELSFNFEESLEEANISEFGFREYDARWLYKKDINLLKGAINL